MRLIELIELVMDTTNVKVFLCDLEYPVAVYDGKNSIDEQYNDYQVVDISVNNDWMVITVKEAE